MRAMTRTRHSRHLDTAAQCPILLDGKSRVALLIVRQIHEEFGCAVGAQTSLAKLNERFLVVQGRKLVLSVHKTCVRCQKRHKPPIQPQMAPLPSTRVSGKMSPFSNTSMDFTGHFLIRNTRNVTRKRYLMLLTCMETRAVHLEVCERIDTPSFLLALMRFVARRRLPEKLYSDNGLNFIKGRKELQAAMKEVDWTVLKDKLFGLGLQDWSTSPPNSPHFKTHDSFAP